MKLFLSALLAAILCVPSSARAGVAPAPRVAVATAPHVQLTRPAPVEVSTDVTHDYAAREAAAPQLARFAGGDGGVYVGTGVLVVALIVVVVILVLR